MKLPSFQFYPGDWLRDPGVRSLTPEERDAWVSILCLMHECEPRGTLTQNGKPMTLERLSNAIGKNNLIIMEGIMFALLETGVCRKDEKTGVLYSKRMVDDTKKVVEFRANRTKAGNPNFRKGKTNPYLQASVAHELNEMGENRDNNNYSDLENNNYSENENNPLFSEQNNSIIPSSSSYFNNKENTKNHPKKDDKKDDENEVEVRLSTKTWVDSNFNISDDEKERMVLLMKEYFPSLDEQQQAARLESIRLEFIDYWLDRRKIDIEMKMKRAQKKSWYLAFRNRVKEIGYRERLKAGGNSNAYESASDRNARIEREVDERIRQLRSGGIRDDTIDPPGLSLSEDETR